MFIEIMAQSITYLDVIPVAFIARTTRCCRGVVIACKDTMGASG